MPSSRPREYKKENFVSQEAWKIYLESTERVNGIDILQVKYPLKILPEKNATNAGQEQIQKQENDPLKNYSHKKLGDAGISGNAKNTGNAGHKRIYKQEKDPLETSMDKKPFQCDKSFFISSTHDGMLNNLEELTTMGKHFLLCCLQLLFKESDNQTSKYIEKLCIKKTTFNEILGNWIANPVEKPETKEVNNRKIAREKVTDKLLKLVKDQCGNHSTTSMAKMLKVSKSTLHSRIKDQKITFFRHQGPCHFCELMTKSTEPNSTECEKSFSDIESIKSHISSAHVEKKLLKCETIPTPPPKLQRKSRCKICKQLFLSKSAMKSHNIEVHDGKKPHCSICSSTFKTEWLLGRHDVVVHGKKKKKVKCKICDTVFKERKDYNEHILSVHDGKKPFPCTKCTSSFLEKGQLKIHILTVHEGIKPHKCNVCNERFGTSVQLNNHFKRVHEGEKNSLCTICGASFFEKSKLRIHIETVHEKKKPYKCSTCDGDFSHSQALRNHIIAVHEKKKPHLCSLCGMSFADKSNLTNHDRGVHRGIKRKNKKQNLEQTK